MLEGLALNISLHESAGCCLRSPNKDTPKSNERYCNMSSIIPSTASLEGQLLEILTVSVKTMRMKNACNKYIIGPKNQLISFMLIFL